MHSFIREPSSYRDPSGFIFKEKGIIYRQVNKVFQDDFDFFIKSGCYDKLVKKGLLIPHETINESLTGTSEWFTTLKPAPIAFITYPFEWSFDMLKDAALLTLQLVRESIASGLILKDATPYNIQWREGKLVFIDTLSFAKYQEEEPWIAYRQFCEQFLGPLLLMHYKKIPLQQLLLAWPEGIPLNVTKAILPLRSKFSLHTYLHIHLHAKVSSKNNPVKKPALKFSRQKLLNLVGSLEILVNKLKIPQQKSTWSGYYEEASQRDNYLAEKKMIIQQWLETINDYKTGIDLGANDGVFSCLLANKNIYTVAADFDPYCINNLYDELKRTGEKNIQPLILDLANPSPAFGVNNEERRSFTERINADIAIALALVHHLAIGKNIPFDMIADLFRKVCRRQLIVEFIPKEDDKLKLMLSAKKDIYTAYNQENFEKAFQKYFNTTKRQEIGVSGRILYLMTRIES